MPAVAKQEIEGSSERGSQRKALKAALRASARKVEREALEPAGQIAAAHRNKLPPSMLDHQGMHLVSDSVQVFNRWSRRLVTFEKT
jgi:hypothetical protein